MKISARLALLCFVSSILIGAADGQETFLEAIQRGDLYRVQKNVSQNPWLLNAKVMKDVTPLQVAIESRQPEVARLLIQNGADINITFPDGMSLLHRAAYFDEDSLVELLLSRGVPVDVMWDDKWNGRTPLEMAAERDSRKAAKVLLNHKAMVNSSEGSIPMRLAIGYNHVEFAKLLVAHGVRCDFRDKWGLTYLHIGPMEGSEKEVVDPDFVDLLLSCGIDVNAMSKDGITPLDRALIIPPSRGYPLVKRLIARGAKVYQHHIWDRVDHIDAATLKLLLEQGIDARASNSRATLLHYLATRTDSEARPLVALVIERGADVHAKSGEVSLSHGAYGNSPLAMGTEGYTPLHFAAAAGRPEVGELLISKGAKVDEATTGKVTPLDVALDAEHIDFARMLLDRGAKANSTEGRWGGTLDIAIQHANSDAARLLIKYGVDFRSKRTTDGTTPLLRAVKSGNLDIARMLVEHGADVNVKDNAGRTPLHWAAEEGRVELAEMLLSHGANVHAQSNSGLTPIYKAPPAISELLLAKGALRPPEENTETEDIICRSVVAKANRNDLNSLIEEEFGDQELIGDPDMGTEDEEIRYVDRLYKIRHEGKEFTYLLGMAGKTPVYLSRIDAGHHEKIVCKIGRKKGAVGYFVRSRAEIVVSRYLPPDSRWEPEERPISADVRKLLTMDAEIHVVSGYEVESQSALKEIKVAVDRPGKKVVLMLNTYRPVNWVVTPSRGTKILGILYSSKPEGYPRKESGSTINAVAPIHQVELPVLYELESPEFSEFLEKLNLWGGRKRIDSFFGKYYLPAKIIVSQTEKQNPQLSLDYPPVQTAPVNIEFDLYDREAAPAKWTASGPIIKKSREIPYIGTGRFVVAPNHDKIFFTAQDRFFMLDVKTGKVHYFGLPARFPALSHAADLAYDTRRDIVSVASSAGAKICFYRFDAKKQRWMDYHSSKYTASSPESLAYDKQSDRYMIWTRDQKLQFVSVDGQISKEQELGSKLPGYYRIFSKDPISEHTIEIRPRGKDIVLVGLDKEKVRGIWHYNLDSDNGTLTYKAK